jgi:hypothetical protein
MSVYPSTEVGVFNDRFVCYSHTNKTLGVDIVDPAAKWGLYFDKKQGNYGSG